MSSPRAVDSEGEIFFNDRQGETAAPPVENTSVSKGTDQIQQMIQEQFQIWMKQKESSLTTDMNQSRNDVHQMTQPTASQERGNSSTWESDTSRSLQPTYHQDYHNRMVPVPHKAQVKIPPFTGKEDWIVWLSRFEAIARRHLDGQRMTDLLI